MEILQVKSAMDTSMCLFDLHWLGNRTKLSVRQNKYRSNKQRKIYMLELIKATRYKIIVDKSKYMDSAFN